MSDPESAESENEVTQSSDGPDRTSIEMLEEGGEYVMKVRDSYMDPREALQEAREVIEVIEASDWDADESELGCTDV